MEVYEISYWEEKPYSNKSTTFKDEKGNFITTKKTAHKIAANLLKKGFTIISLKKVHIMF